MIDFGPLPMKCWPEQDREPWQRARDPDAGVLDKPKGTEQWSPRFWIGLEEANCLWLGWLQAVGQLDAAVSPARRCTPDRLRAYVGDLLRRGAPGYAENCVTHLNAVFFALDPKVDRVHLVHAMRHLRRLARRLAGKELPPVGEFLQLAEDLRQKGLSGEDGRAIVDFVRLRDGLIAALLSHRALRRFNFSDLQLDRDIERIGGVWWIYVSPGATKTGRSRPKPFPKDLVPQLEEYLLARSRILKHAPPSKHLWISNRRRALNPRSLADTMARRTQAWFGKPYRTHIIRHVLASKARDGEKAAVLLDNTPEIARGIYRHASKAQALRHFHDMLGLSPQSRDDDGEGT